MAEGKGLILSLLDQPIEAGSRTEFAMDWTVPEGWETKVLRLPQGTVVPLDVAITTIDDGVVVEVTGSATLIGECVRCLDPIEIVQPIESSEVFVYDDSRLTMKKTVSEIESEGDDLDKELLINRDSIDLEPVLRDAILSEAPLDPVCSEDCLGICVHCGVLLRDAEPGHNHVFLDPRFSALKDFFRPEEKEDGQ